MNFDNLLVRDPIEHLVTMSVHHALHHGRNVPFHPLVSSAPSKLTFSLEFMSAVAQNVSAGTSAGGQAQGGITLFVVKLTVPVSDMVKMHGMLSRRLTLLYRYPLSLIETEPWLYFYSDPLLTPETATTWEVRGGFYI